MLYREVRKGRKKKLSLFFQKLPSNRRGWKEVIITDLVMKNWKD